MFGKNPKRKALKSDGLHLEIQSIFKTIQGEGPFVGVPAIFIRLGGCNLACSFCDTDFEDFTSYNLDIILKQINILSINPKGNQSIKLIVITGGEPLRQNIEPLCSALIDLNFTVQIETNGTLYRKLPEDVSIICSPKASIKGYTNIREDLLPHISAIKFIISNNLSKYTSVPEIGQSKYNIPVYIQPMDQYDERLNKDNQQRSISLSLEHGYRLSLQTHKFLGIE